jgi:hypothetical protein
MFSQTFYNAFRPVLDKLLSHAWNSKWKRNYVYYNAQSENNINMRNFIKLSSVLPEDVKLDSASGDYDNMMKVILTYTHKNLKYTSDIDTQQEPEYWQSALQTHMTMTGDCEDGAIYMYALARAMGVPAWRLKICAGDVVDPNSRRDETVGHAYLIYLSELYNEWFILDWCYYYRKSMNRLYKKPHSECPEYKDIWFTVNEQFTWSQKDLIITEW